MAAAASVETYDSRSNHAFSDRFHTSFNPHITCLSDEAKEVLQAMCLRGEWLSNWLGLGQKSGLSPNPHCEHQKRRGEHVYALLKEHKLGKFSKTAIDLALLYCFHTYPHGVKPRNSSEQQRINAVSKAQTYLVLSTASIWLLDILFDDVRDLYADGDSILDVVDEVLRHFDGLGSASNRSPPDVSGFTKSKQIQQVFREFCILLDLCHAEGCRTLAPETLDITFKEYRLQIEYFRNEIDQYAHSKNPVTLNDYMGSRILSCGFQWNIHTHLHVLGRERGIDDHERIAKFWNSAPVAFASRHAAEYCCLVNDIFSISSDSKHGVANPVKFLGERRCPNGSKAQQLSAGIDLTIDASRASLSKLVTALQRIHVSSDLDLEIRDLYVEVLLFVCFGATTFYILSPRYNLELCKNYVASKRGSISG